ncbi:transposase [Pseudomonas sp. IT-P4]
MPPDEYRSEGTPSPSEGPYVRGETFWFLLGRLPKGTRRKGETASRRYRRNGYVLNQPMTLVGPKAAKVTNRLRPNSC